MIADFRIIEELISCEYSSFVRAIGNDDKQVLVKYNKEMSSNVYVSAELRSEYELINSLDQSKFLTLRSFNTEEYHSAIVYEDNGGEFLSSRLKKEITFSQKLRIAILMTEAVHYLHKNNVLHRNLSPNAFWISDNDSALQIANLSLATNLQQDEISSINNDLIGNAAYISPEQTGRANLPTDNRSDLYSLGAILYEIFSGKQIYSDGQQDTLSIIYKQLTQKITPLSEIDSSIPHVISEIVGSLLQKSPSDRYQSGFGLLHDLKCIESDWLESHTTPPFKIKSEDSPEKLILSRKLYGRENQIAELMKEFKQVSIGKSKAVLISGYSGVGKSALVREIQKPINDKNGVFTKGKCDQFSRDQPFYVFVQAARQLLRKVMNASAGEQQQWVSKLQENVGDNLSLLTDLLPELNTLNISLMSSNAELNAIENDDKFITCSVNFFNVFSSKENPLIIFLDDLQWADTASLQLMKALLEQDSYTLLIGSYRNNELDETHLLTKTIRDLKHTKQRLVEIYLNPLNLQDIRRLLADSLWLTLNKVEPLAAICLEKTQGNPFYVNQFIKMLNEEGLIFYSHQKGEWDWDQQAIDIVSVTSNVVDLMITKLKKYSDDSLNILALAANIGNEFSLSKLQKVAYLDVQQVYKRLWPLISAGYVLPANENYRFASDESLLSQASFFFLHDKVQQAAFQLIPNEKIAAFKWQFGMRLLRSTIKEELDGSIFEIIDQLNAGKSQANIEEQKELIDLNLLASTKAKRSSAYAYAQLNMIHAYSFIVEGLDYRCLEVYNTLAELSYLVGDFDRAETLYIKGMSIAKSALEVVSVIAIQTAQYQIQGRFAESIDLQKKGLSVLDIHIPDDDKEIEAQFMKGFQLIDDFIDTNSISGLINHYTMTDDKVKAAMKLLMGMWYASYLSGKTPLNLLSTTLMTQLSFQHGHDDISSFAYVNYSLAIISIYSRYEQADEFGLLAVKLADSRDNKRIKASTYFLYATFTQHWKHPLQETVPYFDVSYDLALQSGDLATLGYICAVRGSDTLALGSNLLSTHTVLVDDIKLLIKHKQLDMKDCVTAGALQSVKALLGMTDEADSFDNDSFNEAEFLETYKDAPLHLAYFYNAKLRHAYLINTSKEAQLSLLNQVDLISASIPGQNKIVESVFFSALIALRFAEDDRDTLFNLSQQKLELLKQFAKTCPHNYLHKYLLLKAESARVSGDEMLPIDLYSQAIEESAKSGFNNMLAIINECFAGYWFSKNKDVLGQTFITTAYQHYKAWGATAKLQTLRQHWPKANFVDYSSKEKSQEQDYLNLKTVQDINHLISSEIHLDSLLEKLMHILLKNAGAVWGGLIDTNLQNNELWLEAAGDKDHIGVLLHQSLDDNETKKVVPESIIKHVLNTTELCIINKPFEHSDFSDDIYFKSKRPLTVAGIPVIHQGNIIAVVYLENDLIESAFSQKHISLLNVIASQAAISLSHAFLYQSLEKRVRERTEALAAAKLKAEEATVAKSNFLANMSHEIRTPMNAVIGLNRLFKRTPLSAEQQDYVNKISDASESLLGLINNILDFSKIEADKLSLESIHFDLHSVLQKITAICGQKIHEKDLEFIIEVDPNVPWQLIGDPLRLQQVLINLINNAVKFTEIGFIKLSVQVAGELENSYDLLFDVIDTGIGIEDEDQKRLFTSFYQVDASNTRKYGGTGLGLAISAELAQLMGGELQVSSMKNKGSCFSFNANFLVENKEIEESFKLSQARLSDLNILVVDDNEIARKVAVDVLATFGIAATNVSSGLSALNAIENARAPFDLLLIDWKMPEMDGIETYNKIAEKYNIPAILMVSAYHKNEVIALANNTSIEHFIEKPLNASSLVDSINALMSGKQVENYSTPRAEATIPDLSQHRLLLVEDNKINQQVAQGFLMDTMANVTLAENGREALSLLEKESFDCVLMDIQMPVMDGITATQKIRNTLKLNNLPIIAMTAHALRSDIELSLAAGMNAHITKPIDSDVLYKTLADLMDISSSLAQHEKAIHYEMPESDKNTLQRLYQIGSLDIDQSIHRLQDKVSLYLSLVEDFWFKNQRLVTEIKGCLASGDDDKIFLIAHSLKSTAQYIGANKLAEYALILQESSKHHRILPIQIEDLFNELEPLISELEMLYSNGVDTPTLQKVNTSSVLTLLQELKPLLNNAEAASEAVSLSLKKIVGGSIYEQRINKLHYLICDFEFEMALVELENVEKSISGTEHE